MQKNQQIVIVNTLKSKTDAVGSFTIPVMKSVVYLLVAISVYLPSETQPCTAMPG